MTTQYAPPPPPNQQVASQKKNGFALASLILGIVSVVANVLLIPTVLGLVFGIIGVMKGKTLGRTGMAVAGMVLSVVGAIVGIVVFSAIMSGLSAGAQSIASASGPATAEETPVTSDEPANDEAEPAAADPASAVPDGYKVLSDDLWFRWGKTDDSSGFLVTRNANVIAPNGCESVLIELTLYDADETNVGTTYASASNMAEGDKAKIEFSWSPDDGVESMKIGDASCLPF